MKNNVKSYRIVDARKVDGCPTKFSKKNRNLSKTPSGAAAKALQNLCNTKKIRGSCALYITLENTTNGHVNKGKKYTKKCSRKKLKKTLYIKGKDGKPRAINYERAKCYTDVMPKTMKKCKKSSGRRYKNRPYTPSNSLKGGKGSGRNKK